MAYLVVDKDNNKIVWQNPAPLTQNLDAKDVYGYFDTEKHSIIKSKYRIITGSVPKGDEPKTIEDIPAKYKLDDDSIVLKTKEELIADRLIKPDMPADGQFIFNEETWHWDEIINTKVEV